MTFLVTGATGTIGSEVLRLFAERGVSDIRALVHNSDKVGQVEAKGMSAVVGAFEDEIAVATAMADVETVILITPADPSAEIHASNVKKAARAAGVQRIVRVSAIKADPNGPTNNTRAHGKTEAELIESGMGYVMLRPNLFMQNLFMAADQISQQGQFSFAMGNGRMGMIDTRDIAACAVACTVSDQWDGETYELTGPATISYFDVADVLSELRGKPTAYQPVSPENIYAMIEGAGWGEWMAALARDYGQAYASGWGDFTTDNVKKITGTSPRSIRAFASEVFLPALTG
ncbi:SDR family oxidoreductase [Phaeobacter sp. C3_T13_0]|uniref:SDR family oxidoreductase n=1 Tax=Phaeobacter cretensis TaxID=3342641 RepID=UPI0039BD0708